MGLRAVVIAVLGAGIVVAVILGVTHFPYPWFVLAAYWALGLVVILLERGRYRPVLTGSDFEPTAERYTDPVNGETVVVYVDRATGQRDYRPEPTGRTPARVKTGEEP